MAIATLDDLVAALNASDCDRVPVRGVNPATTFQAAGRYILGWSSAVAQTVFPMAIPSTPSASGVALDNTVAGAIPWADPTGGKAAYVAGFMPAGVVTGTAAHTLELVDVLVATGGLSGTVTTAQTVNSAAITRTAYSGAGAAGNRLHLFVWTALGATPTTVTASYTNQAGTAGRTTASMPVTASLAQGQFIPLPLQSGDSGVRSVESVTLAGSTGTAGNFGVLITRPLLEFTSKGSFAASRKANSFAGGLPVVEAGAYLAMLATIGFSSAACLYSDLVIVKG